MKKLLLSYFIFTALAYPIKQTIPYSAIFFNITGFTALIVSFILWLKSKKTHS